MVVEALNAQQLFSLVDAAVHGGVTPRRIAAKQEAFFFSQRLHDLDERFRKKDGTNRTLRLGTVLNHRLASRRIGT